MLKTIIIHGLIGAVIVGALMVAGSLTWAGSGAPPPENGVVVGYVTQLVALTFVFLGVKHYRDRVRGGVTKFLPALGVGLAISAVASLGWVIGWEIVLQISRMDYGKMMTDMMVAQAEARGGGAEAVAQARTEAEEFARLYANPLFRMPVSFIEMFPVGVLVSLVSAGLLRNSRFLPAQAAA